MAFGTILRTGVRLPPLPTIRDLIRLYRLRAIKQLSQNFLMDEKLTDKIVKAAGNIQGHYVLEVGPGPGGITRSIIRKEPKKLIVVEKDERFMPSLELLAEASKDFMQMDIIKGDILKFPIETTFSDCEIFDWHGTRANIHLIGNLPFAISTRLLVNWLKDISLRRGAWSYGRTSMTLTFQKEVADRIISPIMSPQRCRLSVMCQIWTRPELRFTISGKAFVPKPEVDVGVVTLIPLKTPYTQLPFDLVEKVVRHIFSMRQKFCRRGISNLYPEDVRDELTRQTFDLSDVDPTSRSFELSIEECCRLASAYERILNQNPNIENYNYRASKKVLLLEEHN